jgi:hypothetical protein
LPETQCRLAAAAKAEFPNPNVEYRTRNFE